jgi:hypothetical protein
MGIISGLDVNSTLQIVGIAVIAGIVLLSIVGILFCCCRKETPASSLRNVEAQQKKYAPPHSTERFGVLVFVVPQWAALLSASSMHACGSDMRLKQSIAKSAARHGAYYVVEGDNNSKISNRKVVISRDPTSLLRVAEDVFSRTMLTDFCNNMNANQALGAVYASEDASPWAGLELLAALHFGTGHVVDAPASGEESGADALCVEGAVVEDATFIAERLALNRGHCVMTTPFLNAMGTKAPLTTDKRLTELVEEQHVLEAHSAELATAGPLVKWACSPANATVVHLLSKPMTPYTSVIPMTPTSNLKPYETASHTTDIINDAPNDDALVQRIQHRRQMRQQDPNVVESFEHDGTAAAEDSTDVVDF